MPKGWPLLMILTGGDLSHPGHTAQSVPLPGSPIGHSTTAVKGINYLPNSVSYKYPFSSGPSAGSVDGPQAHAGGRVLNNTAKSHAARQFQCEKLPVCLAPPGDIQPAELKELAFVEGPGQWAAPGFVRMDD